MAVSRTDLFDELSRGLGADLVGDPYPTFAERRSSTPVMEGDIMVELGLPSMTQVLGPDAPLYTLFRYDDITDTLRDGETFSSSLISQVFEPFFGRVILGMDGSEHRTWRGIIKPAFAKRLVDYWHDQLVRPVARQVVEEFAAAGGGRGDLIDLAVRYPVRIIFEVIGFPREEDGYDRFSQAGLRMGLAVNGINSSQPEETMRAVQSAQAASTAMYDTILPIVAARRAAGAEGEDLIAHLLRAEFEGEQLDDDQITQFLRSLLPAAAETTSRSWLNVMVCLLERPEVVEEIRADRELLLAAINEGLRLESSTTVLGRVTTREVQVRDKTIPAGAGVTLAIASGNRDEATYERPDVFDLHRRSPKPALNFGLGPHFCPGMQTAKVEMLETTNALLDALPGLRLDPDAPTPAIRGMMARCPATLPVVWDR